MLPIFRRLTLAVVFAMSLVFSQSLHAQCACGGSSGYAAPGMLIPMDGSMGFPIVGSPLPFPIEGNAIYLTLNVPPAAKVMVNGDPTKAEGAVRHFVVRGLEPEKEYEFKIFVFTKNVAGVPMMEAQTVLLKTGAIESLTFKPVKRQRDVLEALVKDEKMTAEEAQAIEEAMKEEEKKEEEAPAAII